MIRWLVKSHSLVRTNVSISGKISRVQRAYCSESCAGLKSVKTIEQVRNQMVEIIGFTRGYQSLKLNSNHNRNHLLKYLPESQDELPIRSMEETFDDAIIPLSTDVKLQDKYVSHLGHVRLGRIMEDMDSFAGWLTMKYLLNPKLPSGLPSPYVIVTVLVDEVQFTPITLKPDEDIRMSGQITWTGKSSLEVTVWLEQKVDGIWKRVTCAIFVMAARNSNNTGPAFVSKLIPKNDSETEMYKRAQERALKRKSEVSENLINKQPTTEEQKLVHDLFIQTVDTSDVRLGRRIIPPDGVWVEDTVVVTNILSHPEDRNLHNKIFGGFLMRQALELGSLTAYQYCKHKPRLRYISHILFKQAVDVGSVLKLEGQVVYTERNFLQVVVHVQVFDPATGKTITTNSVYYTFEANDGMPKVVPLSYHGAMMYLEGRRHFKRSFFST